MAPSAKETKKRKREGDQVAPGSHKRKKRKAASASAGKTATQGRGATTPPRATKRVDAFSTGKAVSKTGAGKATTSTKTASKKPTTYSKAIIPKQAGGPSCRSRAAKAAKSPAGCRPTTRRFEAGTSNGNPDNEGNSRPQDPSNGNDQMNQDASGEIQEMERVQSLVEQQAVTIASEHSLSIEEVYQECSALAKMHNRWRGGGGKRQLGRRKKGDDFKLSASQVELIANRYRVARQTNTTVDYKGASTNKNFRLFNGKADKLRDQEKYVIAMLRMALDLQQQINDGNPEKTSEEWVEEVEQLKLEHKDEIDAFLQTIRELEGANLRLKAGLQQTSDDSVQASLKEAEEANSRINEELASRKKQMDELQAQLEKVEFENFQPKGKLQQQSGAVKSLENRLEEAKADNRKLKQKGEAAKQGGTTHAMQENLDKRTVKLDIQARDQELERGRLLAQGTILDREKKQHAETAEKDKVTHQAWMRERNAILYEINLENAEIDDYARALDQWASRCRRKEREKNDAQIAYNNLQGFRVSLENDLRDFRHTVQDLQEANADLRLWMRSLDACCDVEFAINEFVSARTTVFKNMSGRERRDFCVARYDELYPGRGDDLDRQLRAFTYTRNRICHDGEIRRVPHEDFLRGEADIQAKLAELVRAAPVTL